MDSRLDQRLKKWSDQIEVLAKVEQDFYTLEASESALEGKLFIEAEGRNIEEKKARAHTSEAWGTFTAGFVEAKVKYNRERRVLELRQKAYEAEYRTFCIENDIIQRGKGNKP